MPSTADRLEFTPPRDKGSPRAFGLALLVHVLLIAALTWGVNWKRTDDTASFEAELWSDVPQQAAPKELVTPLPVPKPPPEPTPPPPKPVAQPIPAPPPKPAPPPPAPAAPAPKPTPEPTPAPMPPAPVARAIPTPQPKPALPPPVAKAPEVKVTPPLQDADIALEKEKKRKLLQQQKEAEIRKAQKLQEKHDAELQARHEKDQERKKEKELKAKEALADRKAEELAQKAEAKKQEARELAKEKEKRTAVANAAAEKQKQAKAADEAAAKQKQATAEKQKAAATAAANAEKRKEAAAASEKQHQDAIKRMMGLANAGSSGAAKASGPSAGYGAKVRAKVLPNVVFTDEITGNPKAEVVVNTTADGTIMSQRLTKPSGNKAWDEAVIKAIVRTGSMPRDVDGTVPKSFVLVFTPN